MNNMFNSYPEMTISFVLLILCAFGFAACYESPTPEQEEQIQYKTYHHCASRSSGSSPRCWSAADWDAYCSRVNCK